MKTVLDVAGLHVSLPTANGLLHAVRGIDLTVHQGEMLCIVGESGCGKSMTSMALMGLLPKHAQCEATHIDFDGLDLLTMGRKQRNALRGMRMSMIFQEPMTSLNPSYKLGDQLCEGIMMHKKLSRSEARKRAIYLLERAGVPFPEERLNQYPHQLSGGLRQSGDDRDGDVAEPDLIIADEPTTALDVTIQAQILKLLRELQQEFGTAVIFITHDLGVVARIADRVAVMYAGQIVEMATTQQIFKQPKHPYTRGLIRCIPVPGKTPVEEPLPTITGVVPSLVGEMAGCSFANRCPHTVSECFVQTPELQDTCEQHWVRCPMYSHLLEEASS
ncbi:ABC transporter ATP-binding protein [Vibrio sp. PP-XX7]